jgi:hypothetical protein
LIHQAERLSRTGALRQSPARRPTRIAVAPRRLSLC